MSIRQFFQTIAHKTRETAGFTMIELLVVIAVIGVLAVAVLSSINPIEQINKGRDTRNRTDAAQIINASDRYFAIQEFYPWNRTTGTFTAASVVPTNAFQMSPGGAISWNWLDDLVTTNEVKNGFVARIKNSNIHYITKPAGSNATMYVCFLPTSQAFMLEAARSCQTDSSHQSLTINSTPACASVNGSINVANMICLP